MNNTKQQDDSSSAISGTETQAAAAAAPIQNLVKMAMPQELEAIQDSIAESIKQSESVIAKTLQNTFGLINNATELLSVGLEHGNNTTNVQPAPPVQDNFQNSSVCGAADNQKQTLPQLSQDGSNSTNSLNSEHHELNDKEQAFTQKMSDLASSKMSSDFDNMTQQMNASIEAVKKTIYSANEHLQSGLAQVDDRVVQAYSEQANTAQQQNAQAEEVQQQKQTLTNHVPPSEDNIKD